MLDMVMSSFRFCMQVCICVPKWGLHGPPNMRSWSPSKVPELWEAHISLAHVVLFRLHDASVIHAAVR